MPRIRLNGADREFSDWGSRTGACWSLASCTSAITATWRRSTPSSSARRRTAALRSPCRSPTRPSPSCHAAACPKSGPSVCSDRSSNCGAPFTSSTARLPASANPCAGSAKRCGTTSLRTTCAATRQRSGTESELFGHRTGAFTGAMDHHQGVFERCSEHGALFLDEIGEVSIPAQIKLLQVLQERTFTPLGGHENKRSCGCSSGASPGPRIPRSSPRSSRRSSAACLVATPGRATRWSKSCAPVS
ncbi:MAG TPA: sigma 54-interacting transcriptional regulator [Methylomirabilota bacterium]|nr:sigma 54-interacting transcriptional regulator [Methylomirabilota bacterium]